MDKTGIYNEICDLNLEDKKKFFGYIQNAFIVLSEIAASLYEQGVLEHRLRNQGKANQQFISRVSGIARSSVITMTNANIDDNCIEHLYGTISNYYRLANAFGVSLDFIFGFTDRIYSHKTGFLHEAECTIDNVSQALQFLFKTQSIEINFTDSEINGYLKDKDNLHSTKTKNIFSEWTNKIIADQRAFYVFNDYDKKAFKGNSHNDNSEEGKRERKISDALKKEEVLIQLQLLKALEEVIAEDRSRSAAEIVSCCLSVEEETANSLIHKLRNLKFTYESKEDIDIIPVQIRPFQYYMFAQMENISVDYIVGRTQNKNAFKDIASRKSDDIEAFLHSLLVMQRCSFIKLSSRSIYVMHYLQEIKGLQTLNEAENAISRYINFKFHNGELMNESEYKAQMLLEARRNDLIYRYAQCWLSNGTEMDKSSQDDNLDNYWKDVSYRSENPGTEKAPVALSDRDITKMKKMDLIRLFYDQVECTDAKIEKALSTIITKEEIDALEEYINEMIEQAQFESIFRDFKLKASELLEAFGITTSWEEFHKYVADFQKCKTEDTHQK